MIANVKINNNNNNNNNNNSNNNNSNNNNNNNNISGFVEHLSDNRSLLNTSLNG